MQTTNEVLHHLNARMRFFIDDQPNHANGLLYMRQRMNGEVLPFLKMFISEAVAYRAIRDANNVELVKLMNVEHTKISSALANLGYVRTQIMSSIGARLNLAEADSDIDIGALTTGLNNENGTSIDVCKFTDIAKILTELGFEFHHVFNPDNFSNQYYSFEKVINGIEFEVKVRDLGATQTILALHQFLDNELSDEEITLFTYAKFLFKKFDKEFPGSQSYVKFKKVLYEWAFSQVEGGFVFDDPTL